MRDALCTGLPFYIGTRMLRNLTFWKLVPFVYGLVITRWVHLLLSVPYRRFDYHRWISVSLIQFTGRLLFVLALLDLTLGAIDSSVVPFTSSLCCLVGMYCSCILLFSFSFHLEFPVMFVVGRLQCNNGNAVRRIFGCCIPSVIICNVCIFRVLEQHLCVLGMCLMALDVHPWMLRPTHYGCCFDRYIAFRQFYRLQLSALLTISSAVTSLLTLCLGCRLATLLVTSYILTVLNEDLSLECSGC